MAGGFLGLPGLFSGSPLNALSGMVQDGAEGSPSPPPAPAAAPAPAPVVDPATTGSIGGGGGSSRGLGDMLGDAFSGRGLLGEREGDSRVDPATGVSAGQSRAMSMQSMMGMGLTLLAAGMRQSDDSRAAVLANAPKMLDTSGQFNNFAKMRLEMANARLKERQENNAIEQQRRWGAIFGGSGAASGVPGSVPAPAGAPAALPGTIAPAGVVQPGGPMPATAGQSPATAGQSPATPAPAENPLLNGISPGVKSILGALGPEKGMEKLLEVRRGMDEQETIGEPRIDPQSGQVVADKIKNGRKTGIQVIGSQAEMAGPATIDADTGRKSRDILRGGQPVRNESLGEVPRPLTIETGTDGREFQVRKNAQGQTIERSVIPEGREDPRAKQYVEMEGTIREGRKSGARMVGMLNDFQKAIDNPNVYFGPGADSVASYKRILQTFGGSSEGVADASLATKIQNQLALMVRAPGGEFGGLPGSATDRDLSFLLDSVPSLMATREGAQLVKNSFAAAAERNIEIDKMRREYIKKNGRLDVGFEDMVADKYDSPLLDESQRKAAERLRSASPAPAAPAAEKPANIAVGHVEDGYRYKGGPKGSASSWERVR